MIELEQSEHSENTYINYGDLIDPTLINDVWNSLNEIKIDLRNISQSKLLYVNLGEPIDPLLITETYNNSL